MFVLPVIILSLIIEQVTSHNPCPQYFNYESDGYRTYGVMEVPHVQLGTNLRINVELSLKAQLQNNYYGSLELLGGQTAAVNSIFNGRNIRYKVNFPVQEPLPRLIKILYNGQLICSGSPDPTATTIKLEHTLKTEASSTHGLQPQYIQRPNKPVSNQNQYITPSSNVIGDIEITVLPNGEISVSSPSVVPSKKPSVSDYQWVHVNPEKDQEETERPVLETTTTTTQTTTTTTGAPSTLGSLDDLIAEEFGPDSEFFSTIQENDDDVCGKPLAPGNSLVLNGTPTFKGEFPWLVAIYVKKTKNLEFQCGATLISNQVILTAAHCIQVTSDDVLSENEIVLFVGRSDIDDWTESGYISPKIKKIIVHPDYKETDQTSVDADIALITLKKTIKYTQFIRPACLWKGNTEVTEVVSKTGVVVGWGRDESGTITSKPKKVEMPIVSESTCLRSHESYRYLTSNRTFCAGSRDGSGPCNGDSGDPLTMYKDGRWFLRGIVSTSLYDTNTSSCDVRNYIVFTDVAQFLPWIHSYL